MLTVYRALTRSKLDYGCFVYGSARPNLLGLLDSIHHTGLRLATGAFRTSPVRSLCAEIGEPPLSIRRHLLASSYISQLYINKANPAYPYVFEPRLVDEYALHARAPKPLSARARAYILQLLRLEPILEENTTPPWTFKPPAIDLTLKLKKSDTPAIIFQDKFQAIVNSGSYSEVLYTDGSKTSQGTGYAVITGQGEIQIKLPTFCSIFTAEVNALCSAIYYSMYSTSNSLLICTDSYSALQAIQNQYSPHPHITKLQRLLSMTDEIGKRIKLIWIPSHMGIPGNERADSSAKNAAISTREITNLISKTDLKTMLRSQIHDSWQQLWAEEPPTNKLKYIKTTIRPWKTSYRAKRREEVLLMRLRLGHSRLTHSYLITKEQPPTCLCNNILTIRHIFEDCPVYSPELLKFQIPRNLPEALGDDPDKCNKILKFLENTNLSNRI